jgi:replication initiation and membrane attachment protein DnaB
MVQRMELVWGELARQANTARKKRKGDIRNKNEVPAWMDCSQFANNNNSISNSNNRIPAAELNHAIIISP